MQERVVVVRGSELAAGPPTPGMDRRQAFASESLWAGKVSTEPEMVSGWHHHGTYETVIYVLSGALRMEFGPGGAETVDAGPGDFVVVPPGLIHRESNPSDATADLIGVRVGSGESVFAADGPEPEG
jgi:uncharacterized RmlC-like cupin family protein